MSAQLNVGEGQIDAVLDELVFIRPRR